MGTAVADADILSALVPVAAIQNLVDGAEPFFTVVAHSTVVAVIALSVNRFVDAFVFVGTVVERTWIVVVAVRVLQALDAYSAGQKTVQPFFALLVRQTSPRVGFSRLRLVVRKVGGDKVRGRLTAIFALVTGERGLQTSRVEAGGIGRQEEVSAQVGHDDATRGVLEGTGSRYQYN